MTPGRVTISPVEGTMLVFVTLVVVAVGSWVTVKDYFGSPE